MLPKLLPVGLSEVAVGSWDGRAGGDVKGQEDWEVVDLHRLLGRVSVTADDQLFDVRREPDVIWPSEVPGAHFSERRDALW